MGENWIKNSITCVSFDSVYDLGKVIGSGATAAVYLCTHKGTNETWAVKIIEKQINGQEKQDSKEISPNAKTNIETSNKLQNHATKKILRRITTRAPHNHNHKESAALSQQKIASTECGILFKIMHPNVIRLKEIYETNEKLWMVLEFVKGGELFDRIVSKGYYDEKEASKCVREIFEGLKHLHSHGVVHRDIKPENLLLKDVSNDADVKIADFGLAQVNLRRVRLNTVCGTPGYCAPEILRPSEGYGMEVDCWSAGVIAYILLCGYEPFYAETDAQIYRRILKCDYEFDSPWWDNISENAKDLVRRLLVVDPKKRLSARQALAHPWVSGKAAKRVPMEETQRKLKKLQARRRFKGAAAALSLVSGFLQNSKQYNGDSEENDSITPLT